MHLKQGITLQPLLLKKKNTIKHKKRYLKWLVYLVEKHRPSIKRVWSLYFKAVIFFSSYRNCKLHNLELSVKSQKDIFRSLTAWTTNCVCTCLLQDFLFHFTSMYRIHNYGVRKRKKFICNYRCNGLSDYKKREGVSCCPKTCSYVFLQNNGIFFVNYSI